MTGGPPDALAGVAHEVVAAVERLIAEGRSERVVVHVNPTVGHVIVAPPDADPIRIVLGRRHRKAA